MQDVPPECVVTNGVLPPCLHDLRRDYSDNLRRLQFKMKIPGSEWDVGALMRTQRLEEQPRGVPTLIGPVEIRAAAEAAVLNVKAERLHEEAAARELGIPDDPVGVNSYIRNMYRRCLGVDTRNALSDPSAIYSVVLGIALLGCQRLCLARLDRHQYREGANRP